MVDPALIRQLAREVRNCEGIERTPDQIAAAIKKRFRMPEDSMRRILANRDTIAAFAFSLRYPWQDGLPSSTDLMDARWG